MPKRFIFSLCLMLAAFPLRAVTWTHVNGTYGNPGSGSPLSLGFTPTAGSLLVTACWATGSGSPSFSDNSSGPADTWTPIAPKTMWYNGNYPSGAWATNITGGTAPTTVTCTSAGGSVWIVVDNYTGAPNPFVQDGNAATGVGDSASASAGYTTGSAAGDLVWSGEFHSGTPSSHVTVASPFSLETYGASGYYRPNSADDGVPGGVAASTLVTATYNLQGGSGYWGVFVIGFEPPPPSPATTLSPSSLGFGNQIINTTSSALTETVINTGGANLVITSDSITGTNAADFTSTADTCSGQTITPTNSCTVSVTFTPSATGSRTAVLSFTDNASSSPQTAGLSGTGVALVNSGHAYIM